MQLWVSLHQHVNSWEQPPFGVTPKNVSSLLVDEDLTPGSFMLKHRTGVPLPALRRIISPRAASDGALDDVTQIHHASNPRIQQRTANQLNCQ